MLVVALVTTADVLLRWLANAPIHGLNEIVGMSMAIAVAATLPAGSSQRVNLTIDLLQGRISIRSVAWLKVSSAVLLLGFYVLLAWRVGLYAEKLQARDAETIFVRLPMAPFVWAITAFLTVSAIVQTVTLLVNVRYALLGVVSSAGWGVGSGAAALHSASPELEVSDRIVATVGVAVIMLLVAAGYLIYETLPILTTLGRGEPLLFSSYRSGDALGYVDFVCSTSCRYGISWSDRGRRVFGT